MVGLGEVTVRSARPADAEALATVHVRAWQVGYRGMLPQDYLDGIDLAARVEQWRGWVADARFVGTRLVVAEVDGAVAGFAIHGPQRVPDGGTFRGLGELYSLNVDPDRWGAGVGTALMGHVHAALRAAGHAEAVLWVLPENERARRFYQHHGWAPDGVVQTDTVQGVTVEEMRYHRHLAPASSPPEPVESA